jgi:hypothetical protein
MVIPMVTPMVTPNTHHMLRRYITVMELYLTTMAIT